MPSTRLRGGGDGAISSARAICQFTEARNWPGACCSAYRCVSADRIASAPNREGSEMKRRAPVLLIDDHDDVREGLRMLLEADGWIVETARDGREALNKIVGGFRPCIILLELMSPVMNGL